MSDIEGDSSGSEWIPGSESDESDEIPISIRYTLQSSKGLSHIRGSDAMAKDSKHCELKQLELLTSTCLRKYVATVSQIMYLKENEMEWLASHLGHDIHMHINLYRLQVSTIELTIISKLLIAIYEGHPHRVAGKNLETVNEEMTLSNLLTDSDESSHVKGKNSSNKHSIKMEEVVDNSELVAETMPSEEMLIKKEDAECSNYAELARKGNSREMLIKKKEVFEYSGKAALSRSFANSMKLKKKGVPDNCKVTLASSSNDKIQSYATYIKEDPKT
ncbi:UNVERIFIED_CONTAM: hypothetical protein RMT77_000329 [Armadillidium vulgare]